MKAFIFVAAIAFSASTAFAAGPGFINPDKETLLVQIQSKKAKKAKGGTCFNKCIAAGASPRYCAGRCN